MRKFFLLVVCTSMLLVSCNGDSTSNTDTITEKPSVEVEQGTTEPKDEKTTDLQTAIENYEFEAMEGTYMSWWGSEKTVEFPARIKNVISLSNELDGYAMVTAELESDFYLIPGTKALCYAYEVVDGNIEFSIAGLEVEQDMSVKPVVELSTDCFYAWEQQLIYDERYEYDELGRTFGVDPVTINVTKETVSDIQFDYDGTLTGKDEAEYSDFGYQGEVLFTLTNGRRIYHLYEVTYEPSVDKPMEKWWVIKAPIGNDCWELKEE